MHWCHEVKPYKGKPLRKTCLMMALVVIKSKLWMSPTKSLFSLHKNKTVICLFFHTLKTEHKKGISPNVCNHSQRSFLTPNTCTHRQAGQTHMRTHPGDFQTNTPPPTLNIHRCRLWTLRWAQIPHRSAHIYTDKRRIKAIDTNPLLPTSTECMTKNS